jgi:ATP-dependent protease Clp ATPase subunit
METAICEECVAFSETLLHERAPKVQIEGVCSFCGKSSTQVERLVYGPGKNICNSCITFARQQLDDDGTVNTVAPGTTRLRWITRLRSLLGNGRARRASTTGV